MNCEANPNQQVCLHISTAYLRANGSPGTKIVPEPNETSSPQKLSPQHIDYYKRKAKAKGEKFNDEVVWDLPSSGAGFVVYNPDDMQKKLANRAKYDDEYGYDQIGTKETLEYVIELARQWTTISNQKLQIGDISRPGGIDTPDHGGHRNGKIVDIRPIRNEAYANEDFPCYYTDKARYNRAFTIDFIRFIRKSNLVKLIRFNDFEISGSSEFKGYVLKDGNGGKVHDHHLHLEFN